MKTPRCGYILIEVMLATLIFSIGILSFGQCVDNCLAGMRIKQIDHRARQLLSNRMVEIEAGAVVLDGDKKVERIDKGPFAGMALTTVRTALKKKNEKDQELFGLFQIQLIAEWIEGRDKQSRDLTFYIYPRQR